MLPTPIAPEDPSRLSFSPQLVTELALGEHTPKEVAESYGLSREMFAALLENPVFIAAFKRKREQMLEEGMSVRAKAGLIAEDGLGELRAIFLNPTYSPSARLDAFKLIVDLAGIGAKSKQAEQGQGANFNIVIDLGGGNNAGQSRMKPRILEHGEG